MPPGMGWGWSWARGAITLESFEFLKYSGFQDWHLTLDLAKTWEEGMG